ncbi:MAG: serine hydrolase [Cyanobacteria bacterium J06597_16]
MPAKFFIPDPDLQTTLEDILEETWDAFPQLAQNQISLTWITYEPPYQVNTGGALSAEDFWKYQPAGASYRGVELVDPDSLVQLFYLVAMHVWLEQGMAQTSPEIVRAMTDMVVEGSNDATSFIVDVLSGTTSGPIIPAGPFETWQSQRNIVNRYFQQLGWPELRAVNLNQKTWSDRPYGREREFLGKTFENHNRLTTEAVARLLHSIVGGVSVSSGRSQTMMALLQSVRSEREHLETGRTHGSSPGQAVDVGLPPTAKQWSKNSDSRHRLRSMTYVEAEGIHPYQLVAFIEGNADTPQADILQLVSQRIFQAAKQAFQTA